MIEAILVIALVTFGTRVAPFILFGKHQTTPPLIDYIGRYLPPAVMAMLIVYCLKGVQPMKFPHGLPEFIGIAAVAGLHIWKRNNLLSILGGTAVYMLLIQRVFVQ